MKQKWIQDLKDKMSDFEMEVPSGLSFESVGKAMEDREGNDGGHGRVFPWRPLAAAASVAVVLAAGIALVYMGGDSTRLDSGLHVDRPHAPERHVSTPPVLPSEATASAPTLEVDVNTVHGRKSPIPDGGIMAVSGSADAASRSDCMAATPADVSPMSEEDESSSPAIEDDSDIRQLISGLEGRICCVAATRYRPSLAIGLSVSASGLGDASGVKGYRPSGSGPRWMSNASGANGMSTRMGGLKLEGEEESGMSKDMFEHKLPIGFGLDVSWRFNRHFALQAGVAYTLLRSDIKYGGSSPFTRGEASQHLHYVGIPVAVRYIPAEFRNFSVYLSGGATIEKCVAADVSSRTAYGTPYSYRGLGDRPFQFSVNLGAGVEYDFTRHCGFYVEPSVGYYPDDGSLLRTIYKEHPFTFNLNLGFRFSLP